MIRIRNPLAPDTVVHGNLKEFAIWGTAYPQKTRMNAIGGIPKHTNHRSLFSSSEFRSYSSAATSQIAVRRRYATERSTASGSSVITCPSSLMDGERIASTIKTTAARAPVNLRLRASFWVSGNMSFPLSIGSEPGGSSVAQQSYGRTRSGGRVGVVLCSSAPGPDDDPWQSDR